MSFRKTADGVPIEFTGLWFALPKDEWRKADLAGQAASATTDERI